MYISGDMKQYYYFEHIKFLESAIPAKIVYKIWGVSLHKKKSSLPVSLPWASMPQPGGMSPLTCCYLSPQTTEV